MFGRRAITSPLPPSTDMDVTNVLSRLDSIVDRLEGVYQRLVPYLEEQSKLSDEESSGEAPIGPGHHG